MITLTLPYPLSVNRYWQPVHIPAKDGGKGGHMALVPTKEAKAYKEEVSWIARAAGIKAALAGPVEVTYQLYPHLPKDWATRAKKDPLWWDLTVQCIDLDNSRKVVNDALKNIVFGDDSLIRKDPGEIMVPDGKARIVVTIKPYDRPHPQDSLFAREPVYVPQKPAAVKPRKVEKPAAPALAELPDGQQPFSTSTRRGNVNMTRMIETHKVNPANDSIEIHVMDAPGAGGANHHYAVSIGLDVKFQNGPIGEVGVNGVTQEVLIAICIDRLQCFQRGPFACRENALALTKLEEAMHWLHHRTLARMARGVEGTLQK